MPGPLSRVDVLNFPASQAVTGTFWPNVQPVSGSVGITGTPTVNANVTFPANQQVSGTVAATQSGPWSVGVTSLPSIPAGTATIGSVNVNGTVPVSGTFWQTTQPISATSLPRPAGAATASGVAAVVTALGSPLQQGGTVAVSNFPATQPVSGTVSVSNFPATQAVTISGTATTISRGTPSMATGQVAMSAGNTAYRVAAARTNRRSITFVPTSQFTYFYGNSGVTTTTGAAAPNGVAITLETTAEVWVVSGSTGTMTFVEHFG
jgi:hypothetical protein